ncbi:MAG TPA: PIN domain-containing protein [Intrasporangium sp.]|nr:PIN domain-containing protein [Intrasporangium sp.]
MHHSRIGDNAIVRTTIDLPPAVHRRARELAAEHHDRASTWLARVDRFAVCPVVEGALLRFLLRMDESSDRAVRILEGVRSHPRASFWPDNVSYLDLDCNDIRGHRQVIDVYLAGLAASQGGRLATFDCALGQHRPDDTHLIPFDVTS